MYPFTPQRFRTDDGELSYIDEGTGPTVLFVHGTPSWSFEFREVVKALRQTHRCVAVDHLGFGLSDKPRLAPLGPADHARRLRKFVKALELRDLTLVVHDFGGPIGLPLVLEDDERVARVVLLNTWMWPSDGDRKIAQVDRLVRSPLGRFLYRWLGFSARWLLPGLFGERSRLTKKVHRQYLAPFSKRKDREGTYAMALALKGADAYYAELWEKRSALTKLPLKILWGMKDPAFGPTYLEKWRQSFPLAEVTCLEGCGHFVAEERPEALIAAVAGLP